MLPVREDVLCVVKLFLQLPCSSIHLFNMLLVDALQGSIVSLQLLDCLLLLVYLLPTRFKRSILLDHLLCLLLDFLLSRFQRLLSKVNLLLLLMYVQAFKLETLVHVAFVI